MRILANAGSHRVVTRDGNMTVEEHHVGEWWTVIRIPLEKLHEAYEEYRDWVEEGEEGVV